MFKKILNIFQIFNFLQKVQLALISFFSFFSAIIEIFTLYSLYLAIKLISGSDDNFDNNFLIKAIKFYFNPLDQRDLILIFFIFLVVIFFIKLIILISMYFFQFKFSNNFVIYCTNKIFQNYINNDYTFHVNSDIPKLIRNIHGEAGIFCTGVLQQFTLFFSEICSLVLVISFST